MASPSTVLLGLFSFIGASVTLATDVTAQEVRFPWGCKPASAMQHSPTPYRTLSPSASPISEALAVQPLPPKTGYAYGWFGSNASPTWSRHFGTSQNFTQWTRR